MKILIPETILGTILGKVYISQFLDWTMYTKVIYLAYLFWAGISSAKKKKEETTELTRLLLFYWFCGDLTFYMTCVLTCECFVAPCEESCLYHVSNREFSMEINRLI